MKDGIFTTFMQQYSAVDLKSLKYIPKDKIEKGMFPLGDATDEVKKLYQVINWSSEEHNRLVEEFNSKKKKGVNEEILKPIKKEIDQFSALYEAVKILFWAEIKRGVNLPDGMVAGIREGWKIVGEKHGVSESEITIVEINSLGFPDGFLPLFHAVRFPSIFRRSHSDRCPSCGGYHN